MSRRQIQKKNLLILLSDPKFISYTTVRKELYSVMKPNYSGPGSPTVELIANLKNRQMF